MRNQAYSLHGHAACGDEAFEIGGEPVGGDRTLNKPTDVFLGVLVNSRS